MIAALAIYLAVSLLATALLCGLFSINPREDSGDDDADRLAHSGCSR